MQNDKLAPCFQYADVVNTQNPLGLTTLLCLTCEKRRKFVTLFVTFVWRSHSILGRYANVSILIARARHDHPPRTHPSKRQPPAHRASSLARPRRYFGGHVRAR